MTIDKNDDKIIPFPVSPDIEFRAEIMRPKTPEEMDEMAATLRKMLGAHRPLTPEQQKHRDEIDARSEKAHEAYKALSPEQKCAMDYLQWFSMGGGVPDRRGWSMDDPSIMVQDAHGKEVPITEVMKHLPDILPGEGIG